MVLIKSSLIWTFPPWFGLKTPCFSMISLIGGNPACCPLFLEVICGSTLSCFSRLARRVSTTELRTISVVVHCIPTTFHRDFLDPHTWENAFAPCQSLVASNFVLAPAAEINTCDNLHNVKKIQLLFYRPRSEDNVVTTVCQSFCPQGLGCVYPSMHLGGS